MLELEENKQLINKIEELEQNNKLLKEELKSCQDIMHNNNLATVINKAEDKPLAYEQWLNTEEAEQLADVYAEVGK